MVKLLNCCYVVNPKLDCLILSDDEIPKPVNLVNPVKKNPKIVKLKF